MRKTSPISRFVWPETIDPEIAKLLDEAATKRLPLRGDDPTIENQLVNGEPEEGDESQSRGNEKTQARTEKNLDRGPRKLTAKEMPNTKEANDFYADHPEMIPSKYEDVPGGQRTEQGFRITNPILSPYKRDPNIDVPEWANDNPAVFRVLSLLLPDAKKGVRAYEAINVRWRGHDPADDSPLPDMSDTAVKQLLYRIRKQGDEILVRENGRWYLRKEVLKKSVVREIKKGKLSSKEIIFYAKLLSGLKPRVCEWPQEAIILSLNMLKIENRVAFDDVMGRLCRMRDLASSYEDETRPIIVASVFSELDDLDPFLSPFLDLPVR